MSKMYIFAYDRSTETTDCDFRCLECLYKGHPYMVCCRALCGTMELCKDCSFLDEYRKVKS